MDEAFRILAQGVAPDGFQLADERESLLWGFVNMLDAQVRRLDRSVDRLTPELRDLQRAQDGTEIKSRELELVTDRARNLPGQKPGAHLAFLHSPWYRILKRSGIENLRIHDLRHSFASGGLLVGEGLPMIGRLLGHNKVQTTARYAHLANDPIKSAANRISSRIAEVAG
ncbi:MAG: tyrosine-type recombinase/integrase [Chloroflexi bacterium]|nr:tyrosine-type recombinase/integrase [Chloroflexota bacterium]